MKKTAVLAAGIALILSGTALAAEPVTLSDRIDRVDEVIYGSVQTGSLIGRLDNADNVIYGNGNTTASGLDDKIANLYTDVVKGSTDTAPSMSTRINAMEYYLTDEIKKGSLEKRVGELETKVYGQERKGALDQRIADLEKAVYGDQHVEMRDVDLPANTVFKISLNDDVNSKVNKVGDPVTFTVQEDVKVGDVLVLPRGSQGSGQVTKVTRPKSFGRSGSLDISFDQVFSIDDEEIPTVLGPEAKDKLKMEAAAVGASAIGALALGPIGLVGGFFVKGKDVDLPAGTELYIQTQETVTTKGLVLTNGAPSETLRKHVSSTAVAGEKTESTKTAETSAAAASAETSAVKETEKTAQETVQNTNSNTKETAEKAATSAKDEPSASVVIVRND